MKQLSLIVCVLVNIYFLKAEADARFGVILISKGKVKITSPSGAEKEGTIGLDVFEGDTLTTGPESTAKIVTLDRNVIAIGEKSEIIFEQYQHENQKQKAVIIDVKEGSVRSSIKNKYDQKDEHYHIKTPTSVAGVRGTDFYIEYDSTTKENVICTFEGKVSYKPNESKTGFLVGAGKFIRHKEGDVVKITTANKSWVEKIQKTLEITNKEELPETLKTKSVK